MINLQMDTIRINEHMMMTLKKCKYKYLPQFKGCP